VPPGDPWLGDEAPDASFSSPEPVIDSLARVGVGPALRVTRGDSFAGLGASLDLGRESGIRLQGAWTDVGGDGGEQHYGADLWLLLTPLGRLQPFVGAGAAWVREQAPAGYHDYGAATVRATLDYTLPFARTDARLGVDAILNVPAIDAAGLGPSALFVSHLGLGL
jgi:hypothetical protein